MPLCLLVVDDDDGVRAVFSAFFQRIGYRVLSAATGREAFGYIHQHTHTIDAVILDYRMPDMDGLSFLFHLQQQQPLHFHKRVLFFTASIDVLAQETAMQSPLVAAFVYKPASLRLIASHIAHIIGDAAE